MPKALELRKVIKIVGRFGIVYVTGKGRHPKFFNTQTKRSYPIKAHGKKTMILPYALSDIIDKFDLPGDIFDKE